MSGTDADPRDLAALTAPPEQLDGHTIEELADYLDGGRLPVDPSIEGSPACRSALAALERLRAVSGELFADAATAGADPDDDWVAAVLGRIAADAHAGADFLIERTAEGDEVVMTEGALRALIRAAGDREPGFLVGRVRFTGDLGGSGDPVAIAVDVIVRHGIPIPAAAERLRAAILATILRHTRLTRPRIDITVGDLITRWER